MSRSRLLIGIAFLVCSVVAARADSTIAALTAASALSGPELVYCTQGGNDRKCTAAQLKTFSNVPAGSNLQVQYNSASSFAGSAGFTFDGTSKVSLGVAGSSVGATAYANGTSGSVTIQPVTGALGSSVMSLPAAIDTFVGKATTDTLTNKTYDTAGTGNVFRINGQQISSVSGNTTKTATVSGSLINGNCIKSDASGNLVDNGTTCGAGGGSLTITDGTHSVTGTTTATFGNGLLVSGTTPNAVVNLTVADVTKTTSYSVAATDMGNALALSATTGTPALTLPAVSSTIFSPGMSTSISTAGSTVNWTVTNSTGLTMKGLNSTTLPPGAAGTFVANADGTTLDFYPGAQPPTTTVLGSVQAKDCSGSNQLLQKINTDGTETCAAPFTLTTTGTSGAATFSGGTLNIPQYTGGGGSSVVPNYITGLLLTNNGTSPNSVLNISVGTASDTTNAATMTTAATFFGSTGGAWASGAGSSGSPVNKMGNGLTVASGTWYVVCMANNSGTPDFWFDTSSSCANRPAGIADTKYRVVNAFKTCTVALCQPGASTNIAGFAQTPTVGGIKSSWTPGNTAYSGMLTDVSLASLASTSRTLFTLAGVPAGFPVQAVLNISQDGTSPVIVTSPNESDLPILSTGCSISGSVLMPDQCSQSGAYMFTKLEIQTDTSAQIAARAGAAITNHFIIQTRGWKWDRGMNGS